jgi:soluble lytic murein transglycosylase-like protein
MVRVARCESGLNPNAVGGGQYYGLFQFVPSTFSGTPYGDQSIFDPSANAGAAAWMWSQGHKNEWTCQ